MNQTQTPGLHPDPAAPPARTIRVMVHVLVIPTTVHVAPKALRTRRTVVSRSSAIPLRASTEKNDDVVSIASPSAPRTVGTAAFVGTLAATSSALPAHATTELAQVRSHYPIGFNTTRIDRTLIRVRDNRCQADFSSRSFQYYLLISHSL